MQANDQTDGGVDATGRTEENAGARAFVSENSFHQFLFTAHSEIRTTLRSRSIMVCQFPVSFCRAVLWRSKIAA